MKFTNTHQMSSSVDWINTLWYIHTYLTIRMKVLQLYTVIWLPYKYISEQNEKDIKEEILYWFIYIKYKADFEIQVVATLEGELYTWKGFSGGLYGNKNVFYLNLGSGYTDKFIYYKFINLYMDEFMPFSCLHVCFTLFF